MALEKITYLLGAGASVGALPTVNDFPARLIAFYKKMDDPRNWTSVGLHPKKEVIVETIKEYTYTLIKALTQEPEQWGSGFQNFRPGKDLLMKRHASIDTYAKRLFITDEVDKLISLKIALTAFFQYEQLINHIDIRYDHFLASIIPDSQKQFPDNVKVLTWNYDQQFELAYKPYQGSSGFGLNILSKGLTKQIDNPLSGFGIIKLNGVATCLNTKEKKIVKALATNPMERVFEVMDDVLSGKNIESGISFAWETAGGEIIERAKEAISETDILIVIGYSFPFFNRKIDGELLRILDLTKVYIQDYSSQAVKERFLALYGNADVQVFFKEPDQFFIPYEFD